MNKTIDFDRSPSYRVLSSPTPDTSTAGAGYHRDTAKLIAFYLPQYHRIRENSMWWGPGFTEWTNVAKARPNFVGHYQPHIPRELGFYDLEHVDVMYEQADMAKKYGVEAFCFYYYWFSGRRILERPLDNFLRSNIDLSFCVCWANENWTRTWDGDTKSVLLEQKYLEGDEERFIESLIPFFSDSRYIKVDGMPLLVVYRIKELPNPRESIEKWRRAAISFGFGGLHIAVVDFYDIDDPTEVNADALIEFPPHKFNGPQNRPDLMPTIRNSEFSGGLLDYRKVILQSMKRQKPSYTLYRGIIPSWDNTARRQNTATTIINSSPTLFGDWLRYLRAYTRMTCSDTNPPFIFINAWNEWGEGCHLEPDVQLGLGYLDQIARTEWISEEPSTLSMARTDLMNSIQAVSKELDTQGMSLDVKNYSPPNAKVQKISYILRKHPFMYKVARRIYYVFHSAH